MGVFDNCSVLLELKSLAFKEKKKLNAIVTENGGRICFIINKQCSLVVTSDVANLSSNRLRSIQKHRTPVVEPDYLHRCVERGVLLPVDPYQLEPSSAPPPLGQAHRGSTSAHPPLHQAWSPNCRVSPEPAEETDPEKLRIYSESDPDLPAFPDNFQVAKYSIFAKTNNRTWCVLELQSVGTESGRRYRVVRYWKDDVTAEEVAVKDQLVFLSSSEEALDVYEALMDQLDSTEMERMTGVPPEVQHIGSAPLQQLLLEEKLSTGSLSQEVAVFVETLWTEALGSLSEVLSVPINKLSLNDVSRAEGLLIHLQKILKEENEVEVLSLLEEVFVLLPHLHRPETPPTRSFLSQKLDLCQMIRDVLNVSEMILRSPEPSSVGKYRALRCSIQVVPPNGAEFQSVSGLLDGPIQIHQVLSVSRGVELQTFRADLGIVKPLLHSSSPSNFVGILSRGLLLPRVAVEHHGIERTDVGNLGSGIYFSNSLSTSLKYSKPGQTDQSRLLLVCDVALGRCKEVRKKDPTLDQAPEGHHSVHGVRRTNSIQSDFEDDEFVVYSPDQVKIKYVVQFSVEGDGLKDFQPAVSMSAVTSQSETDQELLLVDEDMDNIKNPLEDVTAGLLDSSGQQLPLQAVHVKCKLMDLLSQVIIFQKYTNLSSFPIEAKYVFPLDDSAAVCGFEAFINGKHVVGQVKEKETARREYKQAIERGHGAFLMDQDAPDVFTISVGNLPPGATVLIKVTFVSELVVKDGNILFSLPGSVAPWQESAALNQTTQVSVQKVCVTDEVADKREFTLEMSVEMPHEISSLVCITHQIQMKRTACKAVVRVLPDQVLGPEGFQLSISLSETHLPRMWVEKHPDKDSQACMLVFYPDFNPISHSEAGEVVLLLDTSESMRGESLRLAQQIALQVLRKLQNSTRINVILFGTDHTEALLRTRKLAEVHLTAQSFIKHCSLVGGSTELWRPLRALSLLPPSRGVRNLLLLSDGHIQNAAFTLQLLKDNVQHSRLFTCGLSSTANRHMLRALAQAGGGAYEYFDTKTKHNWPEKVLRQVDRMSSPGCSSASVKWQQFNPAAPPPVQAPKQLHALFSDCCTLVYGLVPHCTQATLFGNLHGQELKTVVSTTELQMTRGTFLHKLTARALIRDYEDGSLDTNEAQHEEKKAELKSFIIELSREWSILSQFTSFVAVEERDSEQAEDGITDVNKLIAEEDVDFLPYIGWAISQQDDDILVSNYYLSLDLKPTDSSFDWESPTPTGEGYEADFFEPDRLCLMEPELHCLPSAVGAEAASAALGLRFKRSGPDSPSPPAPGIHLNSADFSGSSEFLFKRLTPSYSSSAPSFSFGSTAAPPPPFAAQSSQPAPPPHPPPPFAAQSSQPAPLLPVLLSTAGPPPPFAAQSSQPAPPPSFAAQSSQPAPPPPFAAQSSQPAPPPPFAAQSSQPAPPPPFAAQSSQPAPPPPFAAQSSQPAPPPVLRSTAGPPPPPFAAQSSQPAPPLPPVLRSPDAPSPPAAPLSAMFESLDAPPSISLRALALPDSPQPEFDPPRGHSGFSGSPSTISLNSGIRSKLTRTRRRDVALYLDEDEEPLHSMEMEQNMCARRKRDHRCSYLRRPHVSRRLPLKSAEALPEEPQHKWTKIFQLQSLDGYWDLSPGLGALINLNVDVFANVFLKNKGICSLGMKAHADILRMVATLLVLQLLRLEELDEGKLLQSLFRLKESPQFRPERWEQMKKAVDWVCWADQQYPCICSRLELGLSWESSTRQLLGFDSIPPFSPLIGLDLQMTTSAVPVY
nr:protein mono-ADP-ribosyltransferase PARP4 isoform X2 [Nothobranchius furzeri]